MFCILKFSLHPENNNTEQPARQSPRLTSRWAASLLLLLFPVLRTVTEVDLLVLTDHKSVHIVPGLCEGGAWDLEVIFKRGQAHQLKQFIIIYRHDADGLWNTSGLSGGEIVTIWEIPTTLFCCNKLLEKKYKSRSNSDRDHVAAFTLHNKLYWEEGNKEYISSTSKISFWSFH